MIGFRRKAFWDGFVDGLSLRPLWRWVADMRKRRLRSSMPEAARLWEYAESVYQSYSDPIDDPVLRDEMLSRIAKRGRTGPNGKIEWREERPVESGGHRFLLAAGENEFGEVFAKVRPAERFDVDPFIELAIISDIPVRLLLEELTADEARESTRRIKAHRKVEANRA